MTKDTRLYYEAHITVSPSADFDAFCNWTEERDLKASKFDVDMVDDHHGAWFLSARGENKAFLLGSLIGAVNELKRIGYDVLRWKIEDTVWDSKYGDTFEEALVEIRA